MLVDVAFCLQRQRQQLLLVLAVADDDGTQYRDVVDVWMVSHFGTCVSSLVLVFLPRCPIAVQFHSVPLSCEAHWWL